MARSGRPTPGCRPQAQRSPEGWYFIFDSPIVFRPFFLIIFYSGMTVWFRSVSFVLCIGCPCFCRTVSLL